MIITLLTRIIYLDYILCLVTRSGCYSNPCINGLCIEGLASYYCNCLPTWTGKLCNGISIRIPNELNISSCWFLEKIISPCSKNPCNQGKCFQLNDPNIPFVCLCPNGQFGLSCRSKCVFIYYIYLVLRFKF